MRRLVTLAALVSLGAALLVHPAFGQSQSQGKEGEKDLNRQGLKILVQDQSDSTLYSIGMDGAGHGFTTSESAKDRDHNMTLELLNSVSLTSGSADSSAVLDTHDMRLGMLLLKIVPGPGTGTLTRLAVQVRVCVGGAADSSSVFPIYFNAFNSQPAIGAGAADTTNTGHFITGSASAPWSGEFVVTASSARNSPGSLVAATAFSYPSGIAIPLTNIYGREVYAPYIQVRIRNIVGPTAVVSAKIVGTPL